MLEQLRPMQNDHTLLSPRIPRDTEHERYHPELEEELKECLFCLKRNEMMFDLEVDTDLIEQRIYERHRLLTTFFVRLGVSEEIAAQDACKVEHDLSEETFQKIKEHALRGEEQA